MESLNYLFSVYRQKRRRLGPLAVLHPLRAAALFARTRDELDLTSLLAALLHDILEDINPNDFDPQMWKKMEQQLYSLMNRLSADDEAELIMITTTMSKASVPPVSIRNKAQFHLTPQVLL